MKLSKAIPLLLLSQTAYAGEIYLYQQFEIQELSGVWQDEQLLDKQIAKNATQRGLNFSGGVEDVSYDFKLVQKKDSIDKTRVTYGEVKSFYIDQDITENSSIRFGRYQENWQIGNAFSPLSLTDPYSRKITLSNPYREGKGINGFTYNYFLDDGEINVYYGLDHRDKNAVKGYGYKTVALRYSTPLNYDTDISLILHRRNVGKTGIGGTFRNIFSDASSIYGATMIRQGTTRAIHRGVYDDNPNYIATSNPIGEHRADENKLYYNSVLGMQYTTEQNYNIMVEYSYNSAGMNNSQWDTYKQMLNNHRELTGARSVMKTPNLLWDSLLLGDRGMRQHYMFVRLHREFSGLTPSLSATVAVDKSALWIAEIEYKGWENIAVGGKITTTTGKLGTEYGEYFPYKNRFEIYLGRNF